MKKFLSILLVIVFVLSLASCDNKMNGNKTDIKNEESIYFNAKVVELTGDTMLVEVTDKGNCGVQVDNLVVVSTEKIAEIIAENPTKVTDNYVRVEFNGDVMESYPLQLGEIYNIQIINEDGTPIE